MLLSKQQQQRQLHGSGDEEKEYLALPFIAPYNSVQATCESLCKLHWPFSCDKSKGWWWW